MNLREIYAILMEQALEASSMKEQIWNRIMINLRITGMLADTDESGNKA